MSQRINTANVELQVDKLRCVRDDRVLFDDLSFKLSPGKILQIEGSNGSGKTSLMRILAGLAVPDTGQVTWCGKKIKTISSEYAANVTYIGHKHGIKSELTPLENLRFVQSLTATKPEYQLEDALAEVGLKGFEDNPVRTLSAGQCRRVTLAKLLFTAAPLWLLDEPFTALDKQGQTLVENLIAQHVSNGGMAVLTSHQHINVHDGDSQTLYLDA